MGKTYAAHYTAYPGTVHWSPPGTGGRDRIGYGVLLRVYGDRAGAARDKITEMLGVLLGQSRAARRLFGIRGTGVMEQEDYIGRSRG